MQLSDLTEGSKDAHISALARQSIRTEDLRASRRFWRLYAVILTLLCTLYGLVEVLNR